MEQNYGYNYNNQYTEKPKAKKGKLGTVIALVAAVALIGGGAGFGGAYLASHSIGVIGGVMRFQPLLEHRSALLICLELLVQIGIQPVTDDTAGHAAAPHHLSTLRAA